MEFDRTGVAGRAATADDAVGGVLPRWVALPESTEEISAVLRACAERDLAVVPVGGGTKLHWGAPPERCDVLLDLCCMNDVVEHAAGDLVVRAQAGLAMSALAEHLAEAGQELALDPPMAAEGATVGGTLATAVAGPRAFRYGTARDLLIGITVVLADGTIAKAGGKVVKNVAGYDLGKLFTGSYGTLGVIAEATFRLHPLPADRRWIVARSPRAEVGALALALAASQAEPSAVEIDAEGAEAEVAVLVEGSAAGQRAEALNLVIKGAISTAPPAWWGVVEDDGTLLEVRCPPTGVDAVLGSGLPLRGSAVAGRFWSRAGADGVHRLRELGARVSVLAAPYAIDRWGEVGALPLMRRVKERFDPGRRMSPGRFVGGV
ncbi:FAD-binding oxidoreductase [Nonomuraea sp. NBC_01738]|uniref:FAD-binding oxidoreductase n=1 Tax=Nonomuraea sp. NBC_01738 TaxID=2976003 RepID=UPI002E141648|nr:FAD-binding oxidoreductase [Nonomuraea sp. NBC_01738]